MLFSDFRARGPISILTHPIVVLTEFFHADAVASVHQLPVRQYREKIDNEVIQAEGEIY